MEDRNNRRVVISNSLSLTPQRFEFVVEEPAEACLKRLHQVSAELQAAPSSLQGEAAFSYVVVDERLVKFRFARRARLNFQVEVQGALEQINEHQTAISGVALITPSTFNRLLAYLIALILVPLVVLAAMVFSQQLSSLLQFIAILSWMVGAGVMIANLLLIRQDLVNRIIAPFR